MLPGVSWFHPIPTLKPLAQPKSADVQPASANDQFIRFGSATPSFPFPDAATIQATKARLNRAYLPWAQGLTPPEKFVAAAYTDFETPKLLNQILRDENHVDRTEWEQLSSFQHVAAKIGNLDRAIAKASTPEPLTVYRGVSHMDWDSARKLVGSMYSDSSYGSCSLDPAIAKGFGNVLFEIELPQGVQAAWLSPDDALGTGMVGDEAELLLPRGYRLEVSGYEERTIIKHDQSERALVLHAKWQPPIPVPTAEAIVRQYAGDDMVQKPLLAKTKRQAAHWTAPEKAAVSRLQYLLSVVNGHLRGVEECTFDELLAEKEAEIRRHAHPDELVQALQEKRDYFEAFRQDIVTANQTIRRQPLAKAATVVFHTRDNHLEQWLPKTDPSTWVGQTLTDLGFSRLTPDIRKGVSHVKSCGGKLPLVLRCHLPEGTPGVWWEAIESKRTQPDSLSIGMNQRYTVTKVSTETVTGLDKVAQPVMVVDLVLAA